MTVAIHVPGEPATKGSTVSFVNSKTGKVVTRLASKKTEPYQARITAMAARKWKHKPVDGKVRIRLHFWLKRPKSHLKKDGRVKDSAPDHATKRPDLDKLIRAVLDGLTGVVFVDDSQVTELAAVKHFCYGEPATVITVET